MSEAWSFDEGSAQIGDLPMGAVPLGRRIERFFPIETTL